MSQIYKLKNGTLFVIAEAPGGIYNSTQLKKISELASNDLAIVKATEDQRIGLFVNEQEYDSVVGELESVGLGLRKYQYGLHQPVACIGELCEEHDQDALGSSMELSRELADIELSTPIRIGINGCMRCCTPCHTLDISIVGEPVGYRISLGGKGSQIPEFASFMAEGVPANRLPEVIRDVVAVYHDLAEPGESLLEVMERCGVSEFVEALSPYSQDAAEDEDPLDIVRQVAAEDEEELPSESHQLEGLSEDLNESDLDDLGSANELDELEELPLDYEEEELESPESELSDEFDEAEQSDLYDEADLSEAEQIPMSSIEDDEIEESPMVSDVGHPASEVDALDDEQPLEAEPMEGEFSLDEDPLAEELGEVEDLSEEDELDFEKRLSESIAEEAALLASEEEDQNESEREEALGMLESVAAEEPVEEEEESHDTIHRDPVASLASASFQFAGLDLQNHRLIRLNFKSGAYIDIDMDSLIEGECKSFSLGGKVLGVEKSPDGIFLELEGVRLFYPNSMLMQAS